jgi:hypothetical protein
MTDRLHEGIHNLLDHFLDITRAMTERGHFGQSAANTPSPKGQSEFLNYFRNWMLIQGYLFVHLVSMLLFWFCQIAYNDGKLMIVFWDEFLSIMPLQPWN